MLKSSKREKIFHSKSYGSPTLKDCFEVISADPPISYYHFFKVIYPLALDCTNLPLPCRSRQPACSSNKVTQVINFIQHLLKRTIILYFRIRIFSKLELCHQRFEQQDSVSKLSNTYKKTNSPQDLMDLKALSKRKKSSLSRIRMYIFT